MKFEENWSRGFREVVQRCGQTEDRHTKDNRLGVITIANSEPLAQVS